MGLAATPVEEGSPASAVAELISAEPQTAEPPPEQQASPPALKPPPVLIGVPASPAAVDKVPGTGALGRWLGLPAGSSLRLGGIWAGNLTDQIGGGAASSGSLGLAQQFLLDLSLDLDRSVGWRGASVWVQGLQANANQKQVQLAGHRQKRYFLL